MSCVVCGSSGPNNSCVCSPSELDLLREIAKAAEDLCLERDWDMNPPEDVVRLVNAISALKEK